MKSFKTILFLFALLLLAAAIGMRVLTVSPLGASVQPPEQTAAATSEPSAAAPVEPTLEPTPEPTPTPTPEPTPEIFTISAIGDCTLYCDNRYTPPGSEYSYASYVGENYAYPFSNTVQYFADDDLTIANLECTLSDNKLYSESFFRFLAPAAYANILTEGKVDFVTTANNHTDDYGLQGIEETCASLDAVGLPYGKENEYKLLTTDSGLRVGIYCAYNGYYPKKENCLAAIEAMKAEGAEYIICMFHWGQDEGVYRPNQTQIDLAHACIDAGANLIYGSHSHTLQPTEEYNGGYILYSMANWSFGGSTSPRDMDTAIVQIQVQRDLDGTISNRGLSVIPCCVSSKPVLEDYTADGYNDFCPTPYLEGTEAYDRAMSKITGSFEGPNLNVDYSALNTG